MCGRARRAASARPRGQHAPQPAARQLRACPAGSAAAARGSRAGSCSRLPCGAQHRPAGGGEQMRGGGVESRLAGHTLAGGTSCCTLATLLRCHHAPWPGCTGLHHTPRAAPHPRTASPAPPLCCVPVPAVMCGVSRGSLHMCSMKHPAAAAGQLQQQPAAAAGSAPQQGPLLPAWLPGMHPTAGAALPAVQAHAAAATGKPGGPACRCVFKGKLEPTRANTALEPRACPSCCLAAG